ncbi:hypothetical protein F5Y18DRAFT_283555 [Xylariaceae sp. FL1019]|nr:hypothetical protein F5Y18DRAFT_283555 [Xylariaceae sp. FL1019]
MEQYLGDILFTKSSVYPITLEPLFRAYWRTLVMDCDAYSGLRHFFSAEIDSDEGLFREVLRIDFSVGGKNDENLTATRQCMKSLVSSSMVGRLFGEWTVGRS